MEPMIKLVDEPGPEVWSAIGSPLKRMNDVRSGRVDQFSAFALTLVAPSSGEIIGGLWGEVARDYLYIDLLFVPETARGSGIGRSLMHQAEQEAVRRGCHAVWLSTYSFQAPGFYQKLGYRVFGELPAYSLGHSSIFLRKTLVPEDRSTRPCRPNRRAGDRHQLS